jgi:hypothetical protein
MNSESVPSLARLAAANPITVDQRRGLTPQAQDMLAQIVSTERQRARRLPRPRRCVVAVLIAATVLAGCGAALRAADPFGFWRSSAPDTARFGVSPGDRVVAPTARAIACRVATAATLTCTPGGGGVRYSMIHDSTFDGVPAWFSRASALRDVAKELAAGQLSARRASRLRTDLTAVPASFFPDFRELGRFQTIQSGNGPGATERVPPHGVPLLIACKQLHAAIDCEALNGDEATPVGAGIYAAVPEPDWVTVGSPGPNAELRAAQRLIVAVFGHPLTRAELRLLIDLARSATVGHSSTSVSGHSAPVVRGRSSG